MIRSLSATNSEHTSVRSSSRFREVHATLLSSDSVEQLRPRSDPMRSKHIPYPVAFSRKSWTGAFVRSIAPRRHLRVLPTLTRPSLFGSD